MSNILYFARDKRTRDVVRPFPQRAPRRAVREVIWLLLGPVLCAAVLVGSAIVVIAVCVPGGFR